MSHVLIVEDEPIIRTALRRLLDRNGYEVSEADTVAAARALVEHREPDLVIADLRLPDAEGTEMIAVSPDCPVLIMTSYASVRSAVDAMKQGAVDYVAKPFNHDEMLLAVERILKASRLRRQNQALRSEVARAYPVSGMVGQCEAMREVFTLIDKVAPTSTSVLVLGESGTGKELVARAVHEKSPRSDAPMITVNCAAIPSGLIESELFGHEKGAFTGAVGTHRGLVESADGGTLFLDEIGELPLESQARLLRVLQDGEVRRVGSVHPRRVDIRLIAATHRDLPALVADGQFRDDLYFRLRVIEIRLPALRERGRDIIALARSMIAQSCRRIHRPPLALEPDAERALREYAWPGNVRELANAIERAVILCDGGAIGPGLLGLDEAERRTPASAPEPSLPDLSLEQYFRRFVQQHQEALTETELAERLGISRKALWERRQRLGIPRPKSLGRRPHR